MTTDHDPKRLLDEIAGSSSELGRMLRAGKSEVPNEAQMIALAAKIGILGGLGGAGAAGAGGLGGGGAGAGAGAGAGVASAGTTAVKVGLAVKIGGAIAVATAVAGTTAVVVSKSDVAPPPMGIVTSVSAPVASSSAAPAFTATSAISLSAPSAEPTASSSSSSVRAHKPVLSASPEEEVRLLEKAQDALRSRPAEALAFADDHAKRFPQGMLSQEREVIAIEALVKLNRSAEAKARAARFKARFPGSSHTRRIEALIAD